MNRVLLIGGAGNLGYDLILNSRNNVKYAVLDDFSSSVATKEDLDLLTPYIFEGNVADYSHVQEAFMAFEPTHVFYLATNLSADQKRQLEAHITGLQNVISLSAMHNFPIVFYFQSFLTRESKVSIDEQTPCISRDSYSTWKLAGEFLLRAYEGQSINLILGSVLTSRLNLGLVPTLIDRITSGESISLTKTSRDYVSTKDFDESISKLLNKPLHSDTFLLGSGIPTSSEHMFEILCEQLGIEVESSKVSFVELSSSNPEAILLNRSSFFDTISDSYGDEILTSLRTIIEYRRNSKSSIRQHHRLESK
jgi:nucleoside-diphosphate-sugar epimerase